MSAIVRFRKMPSTCRECGYADKEIKHCRLRCGASIYAGKTRHNRMPLCPLMNEGEYITRLCNSGLKRWIKNVSTVIEAEGSE